MADTLRGTISSPASSLRGTISSAPDTMKGRISSPGSAKGTLRGLEKIQGYSAYQIAVFNGFEGTEEEWLASLKGEPGKDGERGTGILTITTSPSSYTTVTGGFTPSYRVELSAVISQSGVSEVLIGDVICFGFFIFAVGYVDESYVYLGTYTSIRGATGATGSQGLQGPPGAQGKAGQDGERGTGLLKILVAPSSYITTTGGFMPSYRVAKSYVLSQSKVSKVLVGDVICYSYYQYPVGYVDSSYVYLGERTSIRGATGATGGTGPAGEDGYTPVRGTDYWTEADKAEMVNAVLAVLPVYEGEVESV